MDIMTPSQKLIEVKLKIEREIKLAEVKNCDYVKYKCKNKHFNNHKHYNFMRNLFFP